MNEEGSTRASRPQPRFAHAIDDESFSASESQIDRLSRIQSGASSDERKELRRAQAEETREAAAQDAYRRLVDVSRKISSILDLDALLDAILDAVIPLAEAERGIILLKKQNALTIVRSRSDRGQSLSDEGSRVSETLAKQCLEENRILHFDNLNAAPGLSEIRSIRALEIHSAICIPLHDRGTAFGVLYLDSHRLTRSMRAQTELLEAFAAQASVSLSNARLIEQLREAKTLLTRENADLRAEVSGHRGFASFVGNSSAMEVVYERIRLFKDLDVPVLVLGESGTGKELVARAVHSEGRRSAGPFVAVNCAAIPADLLESELFGHERGAFTGATRPHPGMVEQAEGGTLFLDEVGDMPMDFQVKMLRFLESGEYRRVGDVEHRRADVRIVSATNRPLMKMMGDTIREDFVYRLRGVSIELPPLRSRREDIPLLVEHYLGKIQESHPRRIRGITQRGQRFLTAYDWPGNIRQLIHTLQGAAALVPDGEFLDETHIASHLSDIGNGHAGSAVEPELAGRSLQEVVSDAERAGIVRALHEHDWNITRAARSLGISRQHLHNRVRVHGLERPKAGPSTDSDK